MFGDRLKRPLSRRAPWWVGLVDPKEGAVQREVPGHCFSQNDQELFTRTNTGGEVKPLNW